MTAPELTLPQLMALRALVEIGGVWHLGGRLHEGERTIPSATARRLAERGLARIIHWPGATRDVEVTDAGRAAYAAATTAPRPAWLHLDGYAGHTKQPVEVVGETADRYRIRAETATRIGGRAHLLHVGETALVPKRAITFPPASDVAPGWEPWRRSMHATGICMCGATPTFSCGDQVRCARCVPRVDAEPARLDADRTAAPKTRLVGHACAGDCVGPGSVAADALEDVATGARTPLADPLPRLDLLEDVPVDCVGCGTRAYLQRRDVLLERRWTCTTCGRQQPARALETVGTPRAP